MVMANVRMDTGEVVGLVNVMTDKSGKPIIEMVPNVELGHALVAVEGQEPPVIGQYWNGSQFTFTR